MSLPKNYYSASDLHPFSPYPSLIIPASIAHLVSSRLVKSPGASSRSRPGSPPRPSLSHAASLHPDWSGPAGPPRPCGNNCPPVEQFPSWENTYTPSRCAGQMRLGWVISMFHHPLAPPASWPFFTKLAATTSFPAERLISPPPSLASFPPHVLTPRLDAPILFPRQPSLRTFEEGLLPVVLSFYYILARGHSIAFARFFFCLLFSNLRS